MRGHACEHEQMHEPAALHLTPEWGVAAKYEADLLMSVCRCTRAQMCPVKSASY